MSAATAQARRRAAVVRDRLVATSRRRDLLLIGGVAVVLRAAWVIAYGRTVPGQNDTLSYLTTTVQLAHGHGFSLAPGVPTAHWPPGYPFVVSLLYRIFGDHPEAGLGLNVVLASATAVLLYLVADRMLGRLGGRIAGWTFAILPGPIFLTALFVTETTYIFMLVGFVALALFMPDRGWKPVALGVAAGLAALTRGDGVLLVGIPLAMWWGHVPVRAWWRRSAVLVAAMVLTIAPWTIRNQVVLHTFIPISTNASATLWAGHNPKANGGPTYHAPIVVQSSSRTEHELAEDRIERRQAIDWALRNPLKELGLIPRKLIALNQGDSNSLYLWLNSQGERVIHTSQGIEFGIPGDALGYFLTFATLASLVLVGGRRLWRIHPGMQGVLAYLALYLVLYGFVFHGQWRYRIPVEPLMILVATPLAMWVWNRRRGLRADFDAVAESPRGRPAAERGAVARRPA